MNVVRSENIRTRRTIRKFKPKPVSDTQINAIIDAARWAPNAGNLQPWEFVVIRNHETIKRIRDMSHEHVKRSHLALPKDHPYRIAREEKLRKGFYKDYYSGVTVFIAVFVDPAKTDSPLQDGSAAIENMMLAAWSMGLGSAWLDTLPEREIKQLLHVPRRLKFVACIPVGYPAQTLTPPPRKPLEEIIHYEKYGEKRF
jgi:nitroreductase